MSLVGLVFLSFLPAVLGAVFAKFKGESAIVFFFLCLTCSYVPLLILLFYRKGMNDEEGVVEEPVPGGKEVF